jgi:large subunit ribosomal protein L9
MAGKKVKLLLRKSVENLGIVGDIVKVRPGFARNFLLPQAVAEAPTPKKIESLKGAREAALAELAQLRKSREELLERMHSITIAIQRSCNDQGLLYGSVTQRDISDALIAAGYAVDVRSVRLSQTIRRIGEYHVPIQFEKDLRTDITLKVDPDRVLEAEMRQGESEAEAEGKAAEGAEAAEAAGEGREGKPQRERRKKGEAEEAQAAPAAEKPERKPRKERTPAKA